MKDKDKTKEELINELVKLRQRIAEPEKSEIQRKQAEKELQASEEKYRAVVENVNEAIVVVQDGVIKFANPKTMELSGYSKKELIFRPFTEFIHPEDREMVRERYLRRLKGEILPPIYSFRIIDKEGNTRWVEISAVRITWQGKPATLNFLTDITERKKTEKMLRESEHNYRVLFESAFEGVFVIDAETMKILLANQAVARMYGFDSVEDVIGVNPLDFVYPEDRARALRIIVKDMFEHDLRQIVEFRTMTKDGRKIWIEAVGTRIEYQGRLAGLVSIRNITERKKAEEKIKKLYSLQIVIRKINEAFLKVKNEPELFQKICNSLLEIEDFKFAWIGLVQKGTFEVKPVTHAGFEKGYLSSVKVRWDNSEYGRGPTGIAIKTGKPSIIQDIENDPRYAPWKKEAKKRGYASCMALPLIHQGETIGALNVYSGRKDAFQDEEVEHLKEVAEDIAIGIRSLRLEKELEKSVKELEKTTEGIIYTVAKVVETRDPYTAGHQKRVANLACAIAEEMGLPKEQIRGIYMTGTIHDIGKIYVPAEILSKPGKLTKTEFEMIKTHPEYGYNMLKDIEFPWPVALTILQHHERLDGSGYPQGLSGEDIILEACILAVADVVEAMSSHRPYRPALGIDKALEEVSQNKGKLYDSRVVDACLKLFKEKGFKFG